MGKVRATLQRLSRRLGVTPEGLRVLGLAALLNALLFCFLLAVFTPYYETNDDLNMQLIASGFYTGQPSEHLVFTNVLIGWVLRALYGLWNGCNWYAIYLLVVHYCSLTFFAFLILRRRSGWPFVLLYVGYFLVAETRILLNLQFTTTAMVAGITGVLLIADGLRPGRPIHSSKFILGAAFIALMGMIREPAALLLALISIPFLVEHFGLAGWRRMLAMGLACSGLLLALGGINRWYYQRDPAWAEFSEYNRINGEIRVSPMKKFLLQAAPAVGWSENDAWMFSNWYFADPEVYGSTAKLRLLADTLRKLPQPHPYSGRLATICLELPRALGSDAGHLLKLALLSAAWCLFFAGDRRGRYFATLMVLYFLFGLLTFRLLNTSHLPQRVAYNLPLFMLAICLYWASGFQRAATTASGFFRGSSSMTWPKKCLRLAVLACLPVWVVLYARLLLAWNQQLQSTSGAAYYLKSEISPKVFDPLRTLLPPGMKPLLIPVTIEAHLQQSLYFHPLSENIPFSLVPYSWVSHSPIFHQVLEQHRLDPYSLSLVDRADVFLSMRPDWVDPLRIFYLEHYGLEVRIELVLDTRQLPEYRDCELYLYQVHRVMKAQVMNRVRAATDSATETTDR